MEILSTEFGIIRNIPKDHYRFVSKKQKSTETKIVEDQCAIDVSVNSTTITNTFTNSTEEDLKEKTQEETLNNHTDEENLSDVTEAKKENETDEEK